MVSTVEITDGKWQNLNSHISCNVDLMKETSEYMSIKG
jgi:hypothetical protein